MQRLVVAVAIGFVPRIVAADGAFTVALGGGVNVGSRFAEIQIGRRFHGAPHFELYLDYSYNAAISTYPFHTFGIGARTYLARFDRFELFHQALVATALGSGGHLRTIGDRILGAFLTQGIGLDAKLAPSWSVGVVVSTGYPVWLRSELAARYAF